MINLPIIETDSFNKKNNVKWKKIIGNNFYEDIMNGSVNMVSQNPDINRLFLTVNYVDNKDFLILRYPKSDYLLDIGDVFYILFENGEVLEFNIENKSFHSFNSLMNLNKIYENRILLYKEDLLKLKSNLIIDWRIITSNRIFDDMKSFGSSSNQNYNNKHKLQKVLQSLFIDYYDVVSNLKNWKPLSKIDELNNKSSNLDNLSCHLYLMKDLSNGFFKIGISNKPKFREKTLQSEKPSIELLMSKEFPNRKIASAFEMSLHKIYHSKRLRGEWFELNEDELEEIFMVLKM